MAILLPLIKNCQKPLKTKQKRPLEYHWSRCLSMGRMMRFELTNDRFTAGCVRPLHHIRRNAITILSIYASFVKKFLRVLRLVVLFVLRVDQLEHFAYSHRV